MPELNGSKKRVELKKSLNQRVAYEGDLFEIKLNRWKPRCANVLLKPVKIKNKAYDHIWIRISLKKLKEWMPYLYEVHNNDPHYYVFRPMLAIDSQHPAKIAHIIQAASGDHETISMFDAENQSNPVNADTLNSRYVVSGNAKVVKYIRDPKNKLIKHNSKDGFTEDYGISAENNPSLKPRPFYADLISDLRALLSFTVTKSDARAALRRAALLHWSQIVQELPKNQRNNEKQLHARLLHSTDKESE